MREERGRDREMREREGRSMRKIERE